MDDAGDEGLKSNEKVYPESEVKKLKARIAELERALLAEASASRSRISAVARKYGIAPNIKFQLRRAMDGCTPYKSDQLI